MAVRLLCRISLFLCLAALGQFHYLPTYASIIPTSVSTIGDAIELQHYAHSAYLDHAANVLFKWRVVTVQISEERSMSYLDAEISAPTLGYIGWGISPNGGMIGADILIMWVDPNGTAHIQDRYADAFAEPHLDNDQTSILNFDGHQNATHTTFRFRRDMEAGCNDPKHDLNIPMATTHIIFALGEHDVGSDGHAEYHGGGMLNRGSKTLFMRDDSHGEYESDRAAALVETTDVIEIRSADVVIPVVEAFYQCSMTPIPVLKDEVHVVAFEPSVEANKTSIVHHFIMYLCDRDFVPESTQFGCYNADTNGGAARNFPGFDKCVSNLIWSWGIGGNPLYMPKGIGLAFGPEDSGRYILVETHYDSSNLQAPQHSGHSGVRVLLTKKLRAANAKHVTLAGLPPASGPLVPGRAASFQVVAPCGTACTNKFLPAGGINVFSVFLHGHVFTRAMVLRHFRDGEELPLIASDAMYDNHFQSWRRTNVSVLQGDYLMLECNYTTTMRNETVFPGWRTTDEMCMAFAYVTPPPLLSSCASMPSVELSLDAFYPANHTNDKQKPMPGWLSQYHRKSHRRLNQTKNMRMKRADVANNAFEAQLQLVRSITQRNESKMYEIDMMDQVHFDRQLVTKYINGGAMIVQQLKGLQEKLKLVDWDLQHDDIERLQRVYLEEPIVNVCYSTSDYLYEANVPYVDLKRVTRPLQASELSDGCQ